ncbi:hypothetical protein DOK67_0002045 [Enterococcus sp. DIV0212c]|uniref:hypothetical protein n=1 Tax=Enterococcus sp. DIV0212c TaxID=2230867 RepID=UPI001A9ACABA|nr:hypothetical protein [Enterococcus sp. DIV0212c]MBO1354777.1 hypothetical protein [Enterococcus sp. DIV0212c]
MKRKAKFLREAMLCLLFISLLFLKIQTVDAAVAQDYFTQISPKGVVRSGTIFTTDKQVIRPEYQGDWDELLNEVVDKDDNPFFAGYDVPRGYTKDQILYYKDVGYHKDRQLALKIVVLDGPQIANGYDVLALSKEGSINFSPTFTADGTTGIYNYQLVYSDTKEVVKDIYLEFPQIIQMDNHNPNSGVYPYQSFSIDGLKKVYNRQIKEYEQAPSLDLVTDKVSGKSFLTATLDRNNYWGPVDQSYVTIGDNNFPGTTGLKNIGSVYRQMRIFVSSIAVPGIPTYGTPGVVGKRVSDGFHASYDISQAVSAAYPIYYPDNVTVILEDKEKIFSTFDASALKVSNRNGDNITSKVQVKQLAGDKISVTIPNSLLNELNSNSVKLSIDFTQLNVDKALSLFDKKSGTIKIPLTAYNIRNAEGKEVQSDSIIGYSEIVPTLSATAVSQKLPINSTTNDLDVSKILTDVKSTIPGDEVTVTIPTEKVFDTVKKDTVKVQLQSQIFPDVTQTLDVPVDVTDDVVTAAFFENQSWIINAVNNQLKPKQIDKDVYVSDLTKVSQLNTDTDGQFTNQFIPKNIKYLINLSLLSLKNKGMIGTLPEGLRELSKLNSFSVNGNKFVGQVPAFSDGFSLIDISNNQLTVNSDKVPSFLTSASTGTNTNTFVNDSSTTKLKIIGNSSLNINGAGITTIKPFDETNQGNFALQVSQVGSDKVFSLDDGHIYTIINDDTKAVLYEGPVDQAISIPYAKGIKYRVVVDNATSNPNSQFVVITKIPELKLDNVPSDMSFTISLDDNQPKPVKLTGAVSIFDNRDNGHWRLGLTPTTLTSGSRELKGAFVYQNTNGGYQLISAGQKTIIESGVSDPENESIPISTNWNEKRGLQYVLSSGSNYAGSYKGSVTWTLEDVPSS